MSRRAAGGFIIFHLFLALSPAQDLVFGRGIGLA